MATLDEAIAGIEEILQMKGPANLEGPTFIAEAIVKARVNVANQYGVMLEAIKNDERFDSDPQLRDEFAKRLQECRHLHARHQVKWPMKDIADNLEAYTRDSKPVSDGNRNFISWAKSVLKAA